LHVRLRYSGKLLKSVIQ